ncbi:MAG: AAA family ATPase [Anaerolineales bacterium]|nr:AAA family ATPase [Anaerolineales bacterium]
MSWNLTGHAWAVDLLRRDLSQGRIRHAYLITGPDGLGKQSLALGLASALLCDAPEAGSACGHCRACMLNSRATHPDLLKVVPEISGKRIRTGKVKIEAVRQLIYDVSLKPIEARRRVACLIDFDAANDQSQNALLKTLEEPPANVVVILTAESADTLLPTIRSRCEVIALRPLPPAEVCDALVTLHGIEAERADLLARVSGGRPGVALRLARDPDALAERYSTLALVKQLLLGSRVARFAAAERLARESNVDEIQATLQLWASLWRDVLLAMTDADLPRTNLDFGADIEALAREVTPAAGRQALQALGRTADLLGRNVNARLALEVMLLSWPSL